MFHLKFAAEHILNVVPSFGNQIWHDIFCEFSAGDRDILYVISSHILPDNQDMTNFFIVAIIIGVLSVNRWHHY